METLKEQEGTLNDSRHAPASTGGPVDKENADDEEMLDEEEEKIPKWEAWKAKKPKRILADEE